MRERDQRDTVASHKMYYTADWVYLQPHLSPRVRTPPSESSQWGARARCDCVVQEALSYRTTQRSIIEVHVMCAHAPEAIHSTMQTAHMRMLATSYAPRFPGSHSA